MSLPEQNVFSPAEFLQNLQDIFGHRGEIRIDEILADDIRDVLRHAVMSVQAMEEYLAALLAPSSPPPVRKLRTAAERKALARAATDCGRVVIFPLMATGGTSAAYDGPPETGGAA